MDGVVVGTTCIVDGPPVATQSCIVEPWPWPTHSWPVYPSAPTFVPAPSPTYHYHFTQPLSDADVDRIARRVVELQNRLLAGVRALHEMVDQTDPDDPIGAALTRAGLERKP